jgi:hypothetical protein
MDNVGCTVFVKTLADDGVSDISGIINYVPVQPFSSRTILVANINVDGDEWFAFLQSLFVKFSILGIKAEKNKFEDIR